MILARNNNTPAFEWLALPLSELGPWIMANNEIEAENEQRRKEAASRRGK